MEKVKRASGQNKTEPNDFHFTRKKRDFFLFRIIKSYIENKEGKLRSYINTFENK